MRGRLPNDKKRQNVGDSVRRVRVWSGCGDGDKTDGGKVWNVKKVVLTTNKSAMKCGTAVPKPPTSTMTTRPFGE